MCGAGGWGERRGREGANAPCDQLTEAAVHVWLIRCRIQACVACLRLSAMADLSPSPHRGALRSRPKFCEISPRNL